ncbi:MAG: nickel pincer cofactor biosynthesis protein LarC [Lachnospiraceae bacterium]|nr:nickel pincer cofactor biosynthesis protein LarC [Lachnospiraceae bacterium]
MKTLYLDCSMGAAGDMLSAALYELVDDKKEFMQKVEAMGLNKVSIVPKPMSKCGILGTHMDVFVDGVSEEELIKEHEHHHEHESEHHHEHVHSHDSEETGHTHAHHHSSLRDIEKIIDGLNVSEKVKNDAKNVYALIANAESAAHGVPVADIHFHEVGTMDAVCDITLVCMLMEEIAPAKVAAGAIHLGSGHVHCAHGILPVPAPATAYILKGVPVYSGSVKGELCTPTGAALLKYFVSDFGPMPVMSVDKIGYGMGFKDFEQANCVRAFLGDTADSSETVTELSFNVDDMTAERIAFATEIFMQNGALETYTVPVGMKKSRPGILICVMCKESKKEEMLNLIFKHTATLGVRENISRRYTLQRSIVTKETEYGTIRIKQSEGFGVKREKIEYEDLARIARERNISIEEAQNLIKDGIRD